jgi:hypothetical protein
MYFTVAARKLLLISRASFSMDPHTLHRYIACKYRYSSFEIFKRETITSMKYAPCSLLILDSRYRLDIHYPPLTVNVYDE